MAPDLELINCGHKMITKVPNSRIVKILPSVIHYNQTDLIQNTSPKTI